MNEIKYKPIGVIHSPFKEPKGIPIQPAGAQGIDGTVELFPEYTEGLKDVEGFSHLTSRSAYLYTFLPQKIIQISLCFLHRPMEVIPNCFIKKRACASFKFTQSINPKGIYI